MPSVLASPGAQGRVALGSDSRVTGSAGLLDELRVAAVSGVSAEVLTLMVTSWAAQILRLDDAGSIRVGAPADLLVLPPTSDPPGESLLRCRRADVSMVVRRGTPVVGEAALRRAFECRGMHVRPIEIDGEERLMEAGLARRIERCQIEEPGVRSLPAA